VLLVGLTGGIGAGKSTVAARFRELGAIVLDADEIAREVVEPGSPALTQLVATFGADIVTDDGHLDRPALAARAFVDDERRRELEAITHPAIQAEFARRIATAPSDAIVVCDVPLLAESPTAASRGYEIVIVVEAPRELRLDRLAARGVDREDAVARMAAQASDEERREIATYVIENSGTPDELTRQVDQIWAELSARLTSG